MRSSLAVVALAAVVLITACGGTAPRPVTPRVAVDRWSHRDFVERHEVMTFTVLPTMARRFQEYRGEATPSLTCATCHGQNALDVHYRMPNGLPALPANVMALDDQGDRQVRFMKEVVTPLMAELIEPGPTFTCFGCHPRAQ